MHIVGGNDALVALGSICQRSPLKVASLLLSAGIDVVACGRCNGSGKDPTCPRDSRNDICGSCHGRGLVLKFPQSGKGVTP